MFRLGLLALALSTAALAQQNLPGTVTNAPQQMVPSVRPLLTTPTMTLSNGFSPATVTMPQTLVSEQPQTMVAGVINNAMPQGEGVATIAEVEGASADFNVAAVATGSAFDVGIAGPSLADLARQSKNYQVQAHKTYSNEDIDRMNQQTSNGGNGVISATHANGQPIMARNTGFEPASGIANMPDTAGANAETQMANNPSEQNPMNEGQNSATASNADQGQESTQQATSPAAQAPAKDPAQQPMPANDNPR